MKKISIVILLLVALISTMALTACGVDEYTITFESNGGSEVASITVSDIEDLVIPANPTRDGYTFDGWYTDSAFGVQFDSSVMIDSDITLYAKWVESAVQLDTYTVVFYNGEASTSVTVTEGNKATAPTDPTMDSTAEFTYTFVEWNSKLDGSGTAFDSTSVVAANAMYYAQFQSTTNQYTVTFYDSDGTTVLYTADFDYGTTPAYVGDEPTKTATDSTTYAFAGWGTITTVTEDTSYTAQFSDTAMQYTYTFYDSDGTTVLSTETVDYGTTIVAPATPTKGSTAEHTFTFDNWYTALTDGVVVENFGTLTADVSYYAQYKSTTNQYTVKFDSDGGSDVASLTTDYNTAVTKPTDPTLSGHTFDGWYLEGSSTAFDFSTAITANIELTAKWTEALYDLEELYETNKTDVLTVVALAEGYDTDADGLAQAENYVALCTATNENSASFNEVRTAFSEYYGITEELECIMLIGTSYFMQFTSPLAEYSLYIEGAKARCVNNIMYLGDTCSLYYAFMGYGVEKVGTDTECGYYSDDGSILYYLVSSESHIVIPDSIVEVCNTALEHCTNVTSITLGANVETIYIESVLFSGSSSALESLTIHEDNTNFKMVDGCLYSYDGTVLYGVLDYTITSFVVPDTVTEIGNYVFYHCTNLTEITLSQNLKKIGDYAFIWCSSLTSITLPSSLEYIGSYAFCQCWRLQTITIPDSVNYVGTHAFYACMDLSIYCEADSQPSGWIFGWDTGTYCIILWAGQSVATDGDFTYVLTAEDTALVAKYSGSSSSVVISESVTFEGKEYTVVGIEEDAFYGNSLQSITIPSTVTYIGDNAFYYCRSLDTVTFGGDSQLESIGAYAFYSCNLTSITIPASVTSIGNSALTNLSNITSISVEEGNEHYQSIDGNLYSFDGATLVAYASGNTATTFEIPSSVTEIGYYAFACSNNLLSLTIPDGVTYIGIGAFYSCNYLQTVTFADNSQINYLGANAFWDCCSLTSITIPASVTYVGVNVFPGCDNLTIIYCEATSQPSGWDSSWDNSFSGIVLWSGESIYTEDGVQYKLSGTEATVVGITDSLSSDVTILDSVEYEGNTYTVVGIGDYTFYNCEGLISITIPDSVTYIGDYAFRYCYNLQTVMFGGDSQLQSIGEYAFDSCERLTSISISDSVTYIGDYAFRYCYYLQTITVGEDSKLQSIGNQAFYYCENLTSITIPASVTSIGSRAFYSCNNLTIYCEAVSKPSGWDSNWDYGYSGIILWAGESIQTIDNIQYKLSGTEATVIGFTDEMSSNVTIPETVIVEGVEYTVVAIGNYAFYNCSSLTSIGIPDTVTTIGDYAFRSCYNLQTITMGEDSMLQSIGEYAFYNCSELTSTITIPAAVTYVGYEAFGQCKIIIYCEATSQPSGWSNSWATGFVGTVLWSGESIYTEAGVQYKLSGTEATVIGFTDELSSDVTIPKTLTVEGVEYTVVAIGDYAFYYCYNLTSIGIPDTVTTIGDYAFYSCDNLQKATFGENSGLWSICEYAFSNCYNLQSITIPSSVLYIGEQAFCSCDNLTTVTVAENSQLEYINLYAFAYCYSLTSINIPDSVWYIGWGAFNCCWELNIYCQADSQPSGWDSSWSDNVGRTILWGVDGIVSIDYITYVLTDDGATVIDCTDELSGDVTILDSVEYGDSTYTVVGIGEYAFRYCYNMTSITIPATVTYVGHGAFCDCNSLTIYCKADSQPNGWDSEWNYNFSGTILWAGQSIVTEGDFTYTLNADNTAVIAEYNGSDSSVVIEESVTVDGKEYTIVGIGEYAFEWCSSLTSITIPSTVTYIGDYAFYYCRYLETITFVDDSQLQSIGDYAFCNCYSMTSIDIPNTVTCIGDYAFYDCDELQTMTFGDNSQLESIGASAFRNCDSLTSIIMPASVTYVGDYAFCNCSSLIIYCEATSQPDGWDSNWDDAFSGTVLWAGQIIATDGDFTYILNTDNTAVIAKYSGDDSSVDISESITIDGNTYTIVGIGNYAFNRCESEVSITIPATVTYIGNYALSFWGLESVTFAEGSQLVSIGDYAFSSCVNLTIIAIPSGVTYIGDMAFADCDDLTSVIIPATVTYIGEEAFLHGYGLTIYCEATSQPDSWDSDWAEEFDGTVLWGVDGAVSIDCVTYVLTDDGAIVIGYTNELSGEVTILDSVEYDGNSYTVVSIGNRAFSECYNMTSISIPYSVAYIGNYAFSECSDLTITCEADSQPDGWESNWNKYFYGTVLWAGEYIITSDYVQYKLSGEQALVVGFTDELSGSVTIPTSVEYNGNNYEVAGIDEYAFYNCECLTSISIPNTVTTIGDYAFQYCYDLLTVTFVEGSTLETIGDSAFYYCSSLTSISIPASVTSIGDSSFYRCTDLETVIFADNSQLDTIDSYTFYYCSSLTSITIPATVTYIGNQAFYRCTDLETVIFADNSQLDTIDSYAFSDCESLTSITIPATVTYIGWEAFCDCIYLQTVTFADNSQLGVIDSYAFSDCYRLTSITISARVTYVGYCAFASCSNLIIYCEVTSQPSGWSSQWDNDFNGYILWAGESIQDIDGMKYFLSNSGEATIIGCLDELSGDVIIPNSVEYGGNNYEVVAIADMVFCLCSDLVSIVLPDSITSLGYSTFSGCTSLTSITIPSSVTYIGIEAFMSCYNLLSVNFAEDSQLSSIDMMAFAGCFNLVSIVVPASVISIGDNAFTGCFKLIEVYNLSDLDITAGDWGNGQVAYCAQNVYTDVDSESKLATDSDGFVTYTDGDDVILVGYTGTAADITIPSNVTEICQYAFYRNDSITSVVIGEAVTIIGENAFYQCTNLTNVTIGENVASIGEYAFCYCVSLTSVTIGTNVTSIGSSAFEYCYNLVEVYNLSGLTITKGSNSYGHVAYYAQNIYTDVDGESKLATDSDGFVTYTDGDDVILVGYTGTATDITIPSNVTEIYQYAFCCSSITSVVIGDDVAIIGENAFSNCTSLTTVTIGDDVAVIGECAFYNCTSLTTVTIGEKVTSIGWGAFYNCSNITIYCEAYTQPSGWSSYWNYGFSGTIVWGYGLDEVTYSFVSSGSSVEDITAVFVDSSPYTALEGMYFWGWYDNAQYEGEAVSFPYYSSQYTTLYARFEEEPLADGTMEYPYIAETDVQYGPYVEASQTVYYQFTATETGTYTIQSYASGDTYGYLYDADGTELASNDDAGTNNNFLITYELTAGTTYIIGVEWLSSSDSGNIAFSITL